jgi:poly(hydroxyalkanoate) depolymerase family esterase
VAQKRGKKVPLLVYLHGCNQSAADAAVGTRLQELADEKGILVLFPNQTRPASGTYPLADGNGSGCWNWFLPDHQVRGAGEPGTLAGMTREIMSRFAVDERFVWLGGISAGADMTTILGATYPDLFTAIAPIAGCAYSSCADATGSLAYAAMGAHAQVVPALVIQGSLDAVNNLAMGATAAEQWVGTNDLADDGVDNDSVPPTPTSVTHQDLDPSIVTGAPGDPCVGNLRLPCLSGLGLRTYPSTVLRYDDVTGRSVVEVLVIHGANHAYTGGDTSGTFVDPVGPAMSAAMYGFFSAHPRR